MEKLKYPLGRFNDLDPQWNIPKEKTIEYIANYPELMSVTIQNLSNAQMHTAYRPEGWTVCQLVHHVADSHINAYSRFKLSLTEIDPTIKPYNEGLWAQLPDSNIDLIPASLSIINGVHQRWSRLMSELTDDQWEMRYHHPADQIYCALDYAAKMYHWHSAHHLAHITSLADRAAW